MYLKFLNCWLISSILFVTNSSASLNVATINGTISVHTFKKKLIQCYLSNNSTFTANPDSSEPVLIFDIFYQNILQKENFKFYSFIKLSFSFNFIAFLQ